MKRSLSVFAALFFAAAPAMAQHPQHAGIPVDSMSGVWEGPFTTAEGPGGTMSISVAHDNAGVSATMRIAAHMDIPASTLTNIKHAGDKVTWTQETNGTTCSGSGSHNSSGAFVGTLDCGHAILSFTLTKSAAPKSK